MYIIDLFSTNIDRWGTEGGTREVGHGRWDTEGGSMEVGHGKRDTGDGTNFFIFGNVYP